MDGGNSEIILLDGLSQQRQNFVWMATIAVGFYSNAYSSYKVGAHRMHMPRRLSTFFQGYRQLVY